MIRLNKKFYTKTAIEKAEQAFSEICKVNKKEEGDYFEIQLETEEKIEDIEKEFCNHVLVHAKNEKGT